MLRIFFPFLKLLAKILLLVYFVAAGLFLGIRYWVLPNLDQWRPQIAQQLSSALNAKISIGTISADWSGLLPRLTLTDVALTDKRQRRVLTLPHVQAVFSWRSLSTLTPQFSSIEASGLDVSVRRDRFERIWVLGQSFGPNPSAQHDDGMLDETLAWLAAQRHLVLRDSTLRWLDETRTHTPLVLKTVTLVLQNRGADHRFSLSAVPPSELGGALDLRGAFQQWPSARGQAFSLQSSTGQLYAHIQEMSPMGWSTWIDTPQQLESGRVSAKGWITLDAGKIQHYTSDMTAENGRWALDDTEGAAHVESDSIRLYLAGPWTGFQQVFPSATKPETGGDAVAALAGAGAPAVPVEFRLQAGGLGLQAPGIFEHTLRFDRFDAKGTVKLNGSALRLEAERVNLDNQDMDASLVGSWEQGGTGPAGIIDLRGRFSRALIASIDEYLPNVVSLDARDWMAKGLLGGQISDADLILTGDLEHFPFADDPSKGNFRVTGPYSGGVIDYLPAEGGSLGWPRLTDMQGQAALNGADLRLTAERALMHPDSGLPIQLSNVTARIPNIEEDSVLTIQGNTSAAANTYLALMTHSPLGQMLDGIFDAATADGKWEVPLTLRIPLLHSQNTTVQGAIRFSDSTLRLSPDLPPFTQLSGALDFTDTGISSTGIKGRFLGGAVSVSGGAGEGLKGMVMQGQASAAALTSFVGLEGMKRLQGVVPYIAVFHRSDNRPLSFTVDSDLLGLSLDLPPPFGKAVGQPLPLHIDWQRHTDGKSMALGIALGKQVSATLLHRDKPSTGPYFHSAAIGVNKTPELPATGANVDVHYTWVDVDLWDRIITEFSTALSASDMQKKHQVLPPLLQLRLQSKQAQALGLIFDELTFTARRPATAQWRVDISSTQTAGTLFWREANGRIAGRVEANFDRLALGRSAESGSEDGDKQDDQGYHVDDDLDIPGVVLHVKNLKLYGRDAGELSVVGVNQARGHLWLLEQLKLMGPGASLSGSGAWRLSGKDRGLVLNADAKFDDLGLYLQHAGFKDLMKGGSGKAQGRFEWRNMPWDVSRADLNGNIEFDLEKGRFSNVNSRSSRLLELLSLQSVQRLARMEVNPAGLIKEGFPYDRLRGAFQLNKGIMSTSDYRVIGPVGTIVIGGDINLISERLDLEAVVIPNLDISGAAIAAGIAINPIVGVGAFLTQWLLKGPLAKAMTVQYHIEGDWDDPKINETGDRRSGGRRTESSAAGSPGAGSPGAGSPAAGSATVKNRIEPDPVTP